jgi:hypothetical protein
MKNATNPQIAENLALLSSTTLLASLPKLEDLPDPYRQELIRTLAALLMRAPALQALLEAPHEPEP